MDSIQHYSKTVTKNLTSQDSEVNLRIIPSRIKASVVDGARQRTYAGRI